MKKTAFFSGLTHLLIAITIASSISSCHHGNREPFANQDIADINDTLRTGNLASAMLMTEELKRKSLEQGDSAIWSEAMVQQGINAYYQGNPKGVLSAADSAISWLERQEPSKERARVLAKAYQTHGAYYDQFYFNPDSAAVYLRKSVDNVEMSGIRTDLPQAYGNYANAMRMGASLDSAAIYYHRAISIADSLGLEPSNYIPLYNGIAAVFTDMRDFDNSTIWWEKSMGIFESMNQFDKFNTLTGYGNDYYYREDYIGAEKIFTRLRKMLDSVPESQWEKMFTDVNLADTYLRLGRTKEAIEMLDSTARYFSTEQPNPVASSYIHTLQIRAAVKDRDLKRGLLLAKRYPEADTLRLEQHLARLKVLEELYSRTGDFNGAYRMRTRYDHLNDSLRSYKLSQQISTMNAIYQRDHRILNLEAGNTLQKARIFRLLTLIAFTIAIIVGLVLFFVVRRANVRRREDRMMNKIIKLRQENLRNRITPHFIYNALNHELHNTNNGKPSHLDALVHLIRRQQIIASEMLTPFADELKFVDDYIQVIGDNGRDNLHYTYSIDPDISTDFLFPSMSLQILVENAFKHGFTTLPHDTERRLDISVKRTQDRLIAVTVFNNNGECESYDEKGGMGLQVLVETIRLINERHHENIIFTVDPKSELEGITGYAATIILQTKNKP